MSYLVLARKYRPQRFEDLVGQEHVSRTLQNAIRMGRVPHALLLTGVRGVGKTTTARILARALNCMESEGPTPEPCGRCAACEEIAAGRDLDVIEIDAASHTGVDNVRSLQEALPYRPARDRFKVYIVDEVHMLSQGAFNAFLKTLEEPPPHVHFVFATTEPHRVPETVKSRCQRHDFKLIPRGAIEARIREILVKEAIETDAASVSLVAREAAGSMRDALSLLDQVVALSAGRIEADHVVDVLGLTDRTVLYSISRAVLANDAAAALAALDTAITRGADLARLARDYLEHLRNLVVVALGEASQELLPLTDAERREAEEQVSGRSPGDLDRLFLGFARTADEIARSPHAKILLEMALVRMAHREPLVPLGELVGRLEAMERRLEGRGPAPAAPSRQRAGGGPKATPPPEPELAAPEPPVASETVESESAAPIVGPVELEGEPLADWRKILARVEAERPPLASLLEKAVPLVVGRSEIRIAYPPGSFEGTQASDPQRLGALREIVRRILGPEARVEVVALREGQEMRTVASEDAAEREARRDAARKIVEARPAVRMAREVLGPVSRQVKIDVED